MNDKLAVKAAQAAHKAKLLADRVYNREEAARLKESIANYKRWKRINRDKAALQAHRGRILALRRMLEAKGPVTDNRATAITTMKKSIAAHEPAIYEAIARLIEAGENFTNPLQ